MKKHLMAKPTLYRRRFIPDEKVELKDDEILERTDDVIVTCWKTLKPRKDFKRGYSVYFLHRGVKVSLYLDETDACVCTYCDIFDYDYDIANDIYTFNDLLIDVVVSPDGIVKVLDLGEVAEALNLGLITIKQAKLALSRADWLLELIYSGRLSELKYYFPKTPVTKEEII